MHQHRFSRAVVAIVAAAAEDDDDEEEEEKHGLSRCFYSDARI